MEQAQSTGCLSGITVESVRNDFESWRNNKTTGSVKTQDAIGANPINSVTCCAKIIKEATTS